MLPSRPRCTLTYQVNFAPWLRTIMSATNTSDITLALQNATEGFTATVDRPTDTEIIDIRQLLFPVLMEPKYNELTLTHNLSGVISQQTGTNIYTQRASIKSGWSSHYTIALLTGTQQEQISNRPKENMKPSKMNVTSTKQRTLRAKTSLWKWSTRLGTRS